ncbi:unnamed protein product [Phaeothamnion confervicola]
MVAFVDQAAAARPGDVGPRLLMLQLLTLLPEEVDSKTGVSAPPERRAALLDALRQSGGRLALSLLSTLLASGALPPDCRVPALRCALSWVSIGAARWAEVAGGPVLALAVQSTGVDSANDAACELIVACTEAFPEEEAAAALLPEVSVLRLRDVISRGDENLARGAAGALVGAAAAYLPVLGTPSCRHLWAPLLSALLEVLAAAPLDTAALTFDFWGRLADALEMGAFGSSGGYDSAGTEHSSAFLGHAADLAAGLSAAWSAAAMGSAAAAPAAAAAAGAAGPAATSHALRVSGAGAGDAAEHRPATGTAGAANAPTVTNGRAWASIHVVTAYADATGCRWSHRRSFERK